MLEKKEFARTLRMKQSIRQYVEKQPGATFAEKFENMVLYCMVNEKQIKQRIADLNKQADAEQKRLAKFRDTIRPC